MSWVCGGVDSRAAFDMKREMGCGEPKRTWIEIASCENSGDALAAERRSRQRWRRH
jgi:hypothetical protein